MDQNTPGSILAEFPVSPVNHLRFSPHACLPALSFKRGEWAIAHVTNSNGEEVGRDGNGLAVGVCHGVFADLFAVVRGSVCGWGDTNGGHESRECGRDFSIVCLKNDGISQEEMWRVVQHTILLDGVSWIGATARA